ncbi:MAG: SusC/RagA family TonB-linked outer membrane protein [Chitinophagaceae bacterium]
MKFTGILLLAACLQAYADGYSQVTIKAKNTSLKTVFKEIHRQTGYDFLYNVELLNKAGKVSVELNNVSLDVALRECLKDKALGFRIYDQTIVIKPEEHFSASGPDIEKPEDPLPIDVRGRVVNEKGEPVEGVSVIVKGAKTGTSTNANGEFVLRGVSPDAILVLSSVNIETMEIRVKGQTDLSAIRIKTKITEGIDAVVVATGYQVLSRERVTGSSGKVSEEILSKRPVSNLATALEGQIAGLVTDRTVGFIIRGRSTLSNSLLDRSPLLVVDGFPIEGGFETINPNDVKSVDVLKDAAAASIYGARAANGVIVITTKGFGAKGRMNVTLNSYVSVGARMDLDYYMNLVDSKTNLFYDDYVYNTYKGTTNIRDPWASTSFRGSLGDYFSLLANRDKGYITQEYFDAEKNRMMNSSYEDDYQKYILRTPVSHQQNLVISGSSERNSYKFSVLYDNDKTYLQNNNNDRVMLGFTNVYSITPKIKYTFNTNITFFDQRNNAVNLSYAKSITSPWTRIFDEDGNYVRHYAHYFEPMVKAFEPRLPYSMRYNFLEESALRDNKYKGTDIRLQNEFEINVARGLKLRPLFQYENFADDNESYFNPQSFAVRNLANIVAAPSTTNPDLFISQIPVGGILRYNGGLRRTSTKLRLQADFSRTFGGKHEVVAVAGGELIASKRVSLSQDLKYGYTRDNRNWAFFDFGAARNDIFGLNYLGSSITSEGQNVVHPNSFSRQETIYNERFVAGFANASYTLDKKYTVSASVRTDASNYISRSNRERFSPFYSAGIRWNLKNEDFMNSAKFVDNLALRVTYGSSGNAAGKTSLIPFSVFSAQPPNAETGNYQGGGIAGRQNDNLTWEKTFTTNAGVDFSLFKGKLTGSVDLYRRLSRDLLAAVQTSNVIWSSTSQTINAAKVLNKGIEVNLGTTLPIARDFTWSGTLNFDYNTNEVLEYDFRSTLILNYVGSGTFIAGLPTDRIMAIKIAGTSKDGYFLQQKKNGELVPLLNSGLSFAGVTGFGNTIPGLNPKDDDRMYYMGRSTPPATLGFTNTFNWKGLSLMTVMTGRFGHLIRRSDQNLFFSQASWNYSRTGIDVLQTPTTVATTNNGNILPTLDNRLSYGTANTLRTFYGDANLERGSHIRLNEIYLGYDLSPKFLERAGNFLRNATLYVQARNLGIIWTNNQSKVDPEFIPGTIKPFRTFTFGARIGL